jgi:3-deoxy-manno-octulosonate cytidylyltransferase (CMP-KDO synthetase)
MSESFYVVIPARYGSTRFPGKLLKDLGGKTVLERVYHQACAAFPKNIWIAADHDEIAREGARLGANVVMTSPHHQTGTDRIAETIEKLGLADDAIIVNVQGDEPFISPDLIRQVASPTALVQASMSTLCWPISSKEDYENPHVVKVVRNRLNHALYFSRSPIPMFRDGAPVWSQIFRHIGLYAYRAKFLLDYVRWPVCPLESYECLEQLRVLWQGHLIQVEEACVPPMQDINTPEDLDRARVFI